MEIIRHFYSIQQVIFYQSTEIYEEILGKIEEKYTQGLSNENEAGTIFFYYFSNVLDSAEEGFLKGLFYGEEGGPTESHPEKFFIKDNYLVVFSFPLNSEISDKYFNFIKEKSGL